MKLKTSWHCAKWNGLNTDFIIQYILYFKNFCGSVNILLYAIFFLKWRINWRRFWLQCILWSSKIYISFDSRLSLYFFLNGHIHNVVSTLLNFVKNYFEVITFFRRCLTLFISTLKKTTLIRRFSRLWISMLTYTTLFQHWFYVLRCHVVIST